MMEELYLLEELDFASATVRRRNHYFQSKPLDELGTRSSWRGTA